MSAGKELRTIALDCYRRAGRAETSPFRRWVLGMRARQALRLAARADAFERQAELMLAESET